MVMCRHTQEIALVVQNVPCSGTPFLPDITAMDVEALADPHSVVLYYEFALPDPLELARPSLSRGRVQTRPGSYRLLRRHAGSMLSIWTAQKNMAESRQQT